MIDTERLAEIVQQYVEDHGITSEMDILHQDTGVIAEVLIALVEIVGYSDDEDEDEDEGLLFEE